MMEASRSARQERVRRARMRRSLVAFTEATVPGYMPGWVHHDIANRLERFSRDIVARKSPRLMLFLPPRAGKSQLASRNFPAWHLGHNPSHEIILASYGDTLASEHSRHARDIATSQEFRRTFPLAVPDRKRTSAANWGFKVENGDGGGGMIAAGVSTGITGKGAHALVIDDPHKDRKEADSPGMRDDAWDWYVSTARTRLAPGAGILVIQTRWHVDDVAGRLLRQQKDLEEVGKPIRNPWEIVLYEAIAESDEPHRKKGEALHPERYPLEEFEDLRDTIPERDWLALYQQKPTGDDGEYFRRADIAYYHRKDFDNSKVRHYQAWDLAIGENELDDFTVGVDVAVDLEGNLLCVDILRGKWRSDEIVERIVSFADRWKPDAVGIESGHIQKSIGPWLMKRIRERKVWVPIQELKHAGRDKFLRASSLQGAVQHGRLKFPAGDPDWENCVGEMIRFGGGGQMHDDQVDALAWIGLMTDEIIVDRSRRRRAKQKTGMIEQKLKSLYRSQLRGKRSAMSA